MRHGVVNVEEYGRRHRQLRPTALPPLLTKVARPGVLVDIGCGDGRTIYALHRNGLLGRQTYAVDLSAGHVAAAETVAPAVAGIVGDAESLPLADGTVDGAICSQVIEHVPEPQKVVAEIARVVRPGGWWYIGSVLREERAWWIYRRDGRWWLDPIHLREYASAAAFLAEIEHPRLAVSDVLVSRLRFPLLELVLRVFLPARPYRVPARGPAISPLLPAD